MTLLDWLEKQFHDPQKVSKEDDRQKLLTILQDAYRDERKDIINFTWRPVYVLSAFA
jgi:hypothetical protein